MITTRIQKSQLSKIVKMSGRGGWPRESARRTTRQYYFNLTPKVLSLALSRGLEIVFQIRIIFSSAAPSLVLASMFCKKLPDSYVFTATFKKIYIQLLHVLIGQSIQPSVRDVRGDEDCDIRIGGSCGVRDGDARSGVRDGGACGVSFSSAARTGASYVFTATNKKIYSAFTCFDRSVFSVIG